jgi:hypothetical protein
MSRDLKVFFRFFHKAWWIMILVAILLRIFLPEAYPFSDFLINIAATFLLVKVTTFIHEYGHLVAAHFVGATPRRMTRDWRKSSSLGYMCRRDLCLL